MLGAALSRVNDPLAQLRESHHAKGMTDSPRPADLVTEAELLARFWSAELIREVLGKPDWPSSPLLMMTMALAKGKSVGQPGWHAARVIAAEERNSRVQKERALQHYLLVPPTDMISREDLLTLGWTYEAIIAILGPKEWPPTHVNGYRRDRPEAYWLIARVVAAESAPDFEGRWRLYCGNRALPAPGQVLHAAVDRRGMPIDGI